MSAEDCVGCRHINNCLGDCVGYEQTKPQTNEEWLKSLSTKELAEFLADTINEIIDSITYEMDEHAGEFDEDEFYQRAFSWYSWLQEKHN